MPLKALFLVTDVFCWSTIAANMTGFPCGKVAADLTVFTAPKLLLT